ncbi:hypothetical protein JCM8547_004701 [Rhodosporidiobolus lusitaniae]
MASPRPDKRGSARTLYVGSYAHAITMSDPLRGRMGFLSVDDEPHTPRPQRQSSSRRPRPERHSSSSDEGRPRRPSAPQKSRERRIVYRPLIRPQKVPVWDVLMESVPLNDWPFRRRAPRMNSAAERLRFHHVPFVFETFGLERFMRHFEPAVREHINEAFIDIALGNMRNNHEFKPLPHVTYHAPSEDYLRNEAVVGDVVRQNVLLPVAEVLNAFIHTEYRGEMRVTVAPQAASESSRLDHVLVLEILEFDHRFPHHFPLVVVEEKDAGLLHERDWAVEDPYQDPKNAATVHMPQLLLYASQTDTDRYFATDGNEWVAVRIDRLGAQKAARDLQKNRTPRPVNASRYLCSGEAKQQSDNGLDFGPRMAMATEALFALLELGVVDVEHLGLHPDRFHIPMSTGVAQALQERVEVGRSRRRSSPEFVDRGELEASPTRRERR